MSKREERVQEKLWVSTATRIQVSFTTNPLFFAIIPLFQRTATAGRDT